MKRSKRPYKSKVKGLAPGGGSDSQRRLRCALNGKKRAAFWRRQGFPNLERARAVMRIRREQHCDKATARAIWAQELAGLPYVGAPVALSGFTALSRYVPSCDQGTQEKPAPRARQLCPIFESVRGI